MIPLVLIAAVLLALLFWWQTRPSSAFPVDATITIARGLSAADIVRQLEEENAVRSSFFAHIILLAWHDPNNVKAGSYYFDAPLSAFSVIDRITRDADGDTLVRLTLPEGYTTKEFALLATAALPQFDGTEFLNLADGLEGRLFPDTYYIPADFTASELLDLLKSTYEEKTSSKNELISNHTLGEDGVITLASLLEREANTEESMKIVSNILQKRLQMGMRLQVDASIEYVLGRPLNQLRAEDLERDTPYNTYLYAGLPPTPIGNPGLDSINAVLEPIETEYLYYITDEEGNFHYAETFDEHRANIANYLK
ncbi:hypothetical protein A2837_01320 [Candidatus Kaiserbacteria bacterium RIFCSPHIGHO2_01_FULL_46_22]|uniref:Endolytic murein transglycosylase n=1 Tax=Candidatus Kaiserbacteria bacterium RIFCSPHIGHO2_01_FULL_46_22 TaxID=1798475 RepID=A0A1F6BY07_9BACT|nr:MAG: hypothetical protein A2837_01320 [Candidatus Kaiserbacteria bacterium RIFCSPHIGHO2_01_FULL_46_22]